MGDCRIRFQIASSLLVVPVPSSLSMATTTTTTTKNDSSHSLVTTVRVVAADSTVHEILQGTPAPAGGVLLDANNNNNNTIPSLLDLVNQCGATVWDCTIHPGINITSKCRRDDDENDKAAVQQQPQPLWSHRTTLYTAGWFPSGTLQILPAHATRPRTVAAEAYHDCQYNAVHNNNDPAVSALGPAIHTSVDVARRPLPSQMLHSVTQRHEPDPDNDDASQQRRRERQRHRIQKQKQQQQRDEKLHARLTQLRRRDKQTAVSEQVQRMLVQSQATAAGSARPDLPLSDRVYLHCLLMMMAPTTSTTDDSTKNSTTTMDHSESATEEYRYYAHQDTVGRVLTSFQDQWSTSRSASKPNNNLEMELLVSQTIVPRSNPNDNGTLPPETSRTSSVRYRRLPVTMRLYEAISKSFLSGNVDTVVIRWYAKGEETLSILVEDEEPQQQQSDGDDLLDEANQTTREEPKLPIENAATEGSIPIALLTTVGDDPNNDKAAIPPDASTSSDYYQHLSTALIALDQDKDTATKKKKSSSSAAKVRQMQMKSQAQGDTKRVKNMSDRFFFELILADQCEDGVTAIGSLEQRGPMFLARSDRIDRLIRDCLVPASRRTVSDTLSWELLSASQAVPDSTTTTSDTHYNYSFQRIATNDSKESHLCWQDLEQQGKVQGFDRFVLVLLHR